MKFFRYQNNTDTESVNILNSVIYSEKKVVAEEQDKLLYKKPVVMCT